jgi:uncharacterized membrane protein (UPF0127 family)
VIDAPEPAPASTPDPTTVRWLWWGIGAALVAGLLFFLLRGSDQPKNPSLLPAGVTTPPPGSQAGSGGRTLLPGFGETAITVHLPSGEVLNWCVLLATSEAQHERGLMEVTDPKLGGYDGMLFRFSTPQSGAFYMKNTPMPLTIAFLGEGGAFVSETDMAPCLGQEDCPLYYAAAPYLNALEVPQGYLPKLRITPDATVVDEAKACAA